MKCKNCGAEAGVGAKVCPYCDSELEEKEKIYIDRPVHVYDNEPAPQGLEADNLTFKLNKTAALSLVTGVLGIVFSFYGIGIVFGIIGLVAAYRVSREAKNAGRKIPTLLRVSKPLNIVAIAAGSVGTLSTLVSSLYRLLGDRLL